MTPIAILFGVGLFVVLMLVFLLLLSPKTSPQSAMLQQVAKESTQRQRGADTPFSSVYVEWLAKPVEFLRGFISHKPDPALLRRLSIAGYKQKAHADLFLGARLVVPALFGVLTAVLTDENSFFFFAIALIVGFFAPDFWLGEAIKRRKARIGDTLPDALDLMSICMDAGLGLDQAIVRVAQELRTAHPDLAEEMMQINFEQRAGVPRIESWRALAERVDLESLRQFVAMLVQTERFGTPLGVALATFSESLRTERRQVAEELGAKAAIKMMFPLVVFIFPMVFIVTVGPAVVGLIKNMANLLQ
jgi:tight adherence protein C